jgi:metallophosphoesterase superfamily enzyme
MNLNEIKQFLTNRPGYLKEGGYRLCKKLNLTTTESNIDLCKLAIKQVKNEIKNQPGVGSTIFNVTLDKEYKTSKDVFKSAFKMGIFPIDTFKEQVKKLKSGKNVLVIGDLHLPFTLDGYLEHCLEIYNEYKCDEVVFIGDIIDNHATSYHETDPDGHSAGQELAMAISEIRKWYSVFPKATVIIGNHDRLIMRKAYSAGVSKLWIKDYSEVLGVPGWNFTESIEIDDVLYIHGEGGTARNRVNSDLQSIVQGHLHTQCYVEWYVGSKFKLFGMQVGCGINHKSYAMAYAKENKKPAIACGVVLKGKTPINCLMEL